jgi:hypothetical protein
MTKTSSKHDALGGSAVLDRREVVGKIGIVAAGVAAAILLPVGPSLASAVAKSISARSASPVSYPHGGIPADFLSYSESIPYVYPRLAE